MDLFVPQKESARVDESQIRFNIAWGWKTNAHLLPDKLLQPDEFICTTFQLAEDVSLSVSYYEKSDNIAKAFMVFVAYCPGYGSVSIKYDSLTNTNVALRYRQQDSQWYGRIYIENSDKHRHTYSRYGRKGIFRFPITLLLVGSPPPSATPPPPPPPPQCGGPKLGRGRLFDPAISDVTFVLNSDKGVIKIPTSRYVLADASEVFYRMFSAGFSESKAQLPIRIAVNDVDEGPVRAMVEFVTTNSIITELADISQRKQLYDLSEKYKLDSLASAAADLIIKINLNVETMIELLEFAGKYSRKVLFTACFEYFKEHRKELDKEALTRALESGNCGVVTAAVKLLMD
ncbi:hypothetical protein SeLEV6574_g04457 [Synchytrium endobioticum]|uniref:BTB domain-containing protein n=1 Tax=Synchytrium endobioticum TaxID=286115 RepID=A0A507CZC0_9FUNG|nr:hypothetical protein SeLEV6574_g04457 [Synchytrium endobioticum]